MALLPDITAIDIGSATRDMGSFMPALKDYFDQQKTTAGDSTNIDSIRQDNRGSTGASEGPAQSPRFSLVKNSNSPTAFTIQPKSADENWQFNLRIGSSNTDTRALGGYDPQGKVSDPENPGTGGIQDATVGPSSTNSTGNPEESPEEYAFTLTSGTGSNNVSSSMYVIEFDDAFWILIPGSSETSIKGGGGHIGKTINTIFPSISSGLSFHANRNVDDPELWFNGEGITSPYNIVQFGLDQWEVNKADRSINNFNLGWKSGVDMAQTYGAFRIDTPDGREREIGIIKYFLVMRDQQETPGIVLDGGSKTDLVFVDSDGNNTTPYVIPWDANLTPIFQ
jgi:hypothetical protein